jgi:hypothetical protein
MAENSQSQEAENKPTTRISEDWLAVLIASILILLSVLGVLGENGLSIRF